MKVDEAASNFSTMFLGVRLGRWATMSTSFGNSYDAYIKCLTRSNDKESDNARYYTCNRNFEDKILEAPYFRNGNHHRITYYAKAPLIWTSNTEIAAELNCLFNNKYVENISIQGFGVFGEDPRIEMCYRIYSQDDEIDYEIVETIGLNFYKDLEEMILEANRQIQEIKDKGCFITTAVCKSLGAADNCYELNAFRYFRDTWLEAQSDGKMLIQKYYDLAPKIVHAIDQENDATSIYHQIWLQYLEPCLRYIENHDMEQCKSLYTKMVKQLGLKYLRRTV